MYPDDATIDRIAKWPVLGREDARALLAFVLANWHLADWGWKQDGDKFHVSTGGWSGNEDIIVALEENYIFWGMCWQSSKRGGHYEFELPKPTEERG